MVYALRSFVGLCLVVLLGLPIHATELELGVLIQEALEKNPNLSVLRARLTAFEAQVPQAGALDDPVLKFEASNVPLNGFNLSSTPMSGNQFMLSQNFPLPGKRSAKERSAKHAVGIVEWQLRDREIAIVNAVKQPFLTLSYVVRAIATTQKNRVLLQDLIRIARKKYEVGKGLQQDVLKAQVALAALDKQLIGLRAEKKLAEARLNLVLNRAPQSTLGAPPDTIALSSDPLSVVQLQNLANDSRASLKALDQSILMWQAQAELARKNFWPDIAVNLGYRQRMFMANDPVKGSDFLSLGIGVQVPLFRGRKQRQKVIEAQANMQRVEAQKVSDRQQIHYEIQRLMVEADQHRESAELFVSSILPQAKQSLSSALSGYQVDKVDFLTLLDNYMTLLDFEIEYYHHVIAHEKRRADIEAVVGVAWRARGE